MVCTILGFMILSSVLVWMPGFVWLFCFACVWLMQVRTMARADNLAQASLPRLGEMSRDSLRPFHASGRSSNQLSFERASRSGEGSLA